MSRRIRWSCILIFTAPIGIALGFAYLRIVWQQGRKARHHRLTLARIVLCLATVGPLFAAGLRGLIRV